MTMPVAAISVHPLVRPVVDGYLAARDTVPREMWSVSERNGRWRLPDPPQRGSLIEKGELLAIHEIQRHRSPERDAWAIRMAHDGIDKLWWDAAANARSHNSAVKGWKMTVAMAGAMATAGAAGAVEKRRHQRLRPFEVDSGVSMTLDKRPFGSSYPSGHAAVAAAAGAVLALMDPERASTYRGLAAEVAASRLYAGVHFPSDVVAGAAMGEAIGRSAASAAMRIPGFDGASRYALRGLSELTGPGGLLRLQLASADELA